MKKVILTLAVIVATGVAASASNTVTCDTVSKKETKETKETNKFALVAQNQIVPVTDLNKLPQVVKDAVTKDFPGGSIKSASFDETKKSYTLMVVAKDAKEVTPVVYSEKGVKVTK